MSPDTDWPTRPVLPGRHLHPARARPEHRRRPRGPARPRLRRVLRHRRLHDGAARHRSTAGRFWEIAARRRSSSAHVAGVLLGAPTLRLRGDYLAIVTLGFGEIVRITAQQHRLASAAPRGITGIPHPPTDRLGAASSACSTRSRTTTCCSSLIVLVDHPRQRGCERSRVGRAWAAIREDEDAAELMGVPTFKFKLLRVRDRRGDRRRWPAWSSPARSIFDQPGQLPVHPVGDDPRRGGARRRRATCPASSSARSLDRLAARSGSAALAATYRVLVVRRGAGAS